MFKSLLIFITFLLPASALPEEQVRVTDLGWLTGSWSGQVGPAVLEENWSLPRAGTIASLVRQTGPDGMGMVEMVYIEEANGTLDLYLQQWDTGFKSKNDDERDNRKLHYL